MNFKFRRSSSTTEEAVYVPIKRKLPKWQWYVLALIVLSPLIYLLGKWILSLLFVTASGYVTTDTLTIRAPYDAYVEDRTVQLADHVKPGDMLIRLNSPSLNAQIASLETNIGLLKIQRQGYQNKTLPELRKLQRTAEAHVAKTKNYYQKFQHYYKQGLITVMDLSIAEDRYHQSLTHLQQIKTQIQKDQEEHSITSQQNYDQILGPEASRLSALQAIQASLTIKASQSAIVSEVNAQKLEFVKQGMSLMTLSTSENWHVTAFFEGKEIAKVHPGISVKLLLPNFTMLSGHVINQPSMAQTETHTLAILQNPEQKLVAYVHFDQPLPEKYQVNGLHVTVIVF